MAVHPRRARQKRLLREVILDAAREIVGREGYAGLSMRKVAEKIDYSPTAIYLHFTDRDDLVFSVCEQLIVGLVRELEDVRSRHADPLVALKKALRRYVEFGLKHPEHYQAAFMTPQRGDPDPDRRFPEPNTMGVQAFGFLPSLVAECVRQKKLARVDVHAASCALWAGIHGITSLQIAMPNFPWNDRDQVIEQLIGMMIAGLK